MGYFLMMARANNFSGGFFRLVLWVIPYLMKKIGDNFLAMIKEVLKEVLKDEASR